MGGQLLGFNACMPAGNILQANQMSQLLAPRCCWQASAPWRWKPCATSAMRFKPRYDLWRLARTRHQDSWSWLQVTKLRHRLRHFDLSTQSRLFMPRAALHGSRISSV